MTKIDFEFQTEYGGGVTFDFIVAGLDQAADETQFLDAALKLRDTRRGRGAGRMGQLANAHEILGIQANDVMDQVVRDARPALAHRRIALVMAHARRKIAKKA